MLASGGGPSHLLILPLVVLLSTNGFPPSSTTLTAIHGASMLQYLLVHPLHEVEGVCKDLSCTVQYDDATHTITHASFSADVSSFDSGNSNRDSHAMEVLDALEYPTVSFESTAIRETGDDLGVTGNLTFHGQTRPIIFEATDSARSDTLRVQGSAKISLTAFGIERPTLLMIPVHDTLRISFLMRFPLPTH